MNQVSLERKRIPDVCLLKVELLLDKVLMQALEIDKDLEGAIHVARVTKVLESNSAAIRTGTATEVSRALPHSLFLQS